MAFQLFLPDARCKTHQPIDRRGTLKTLLFKIRGNTSQFWDEHPALLIGLTLLIGTSLFPLALFLIWIFYLIWIRHPLQILLLIGSAFYGWGMLPPKDLPKGEVKALFSPNSLQPHQSPFEKGLVYRGLLSLEKTQLPCSIYYRGPLSDRPLGNQTFFMQGKLEQRGVSDFTFKTKEWIPLYSNRSLGEMRYQMKEALRNYLETHLPSPRTALFLSSLTTGDVEDRLLRYEFSRVGLQHLLAISGFHFGILIAFASSLLSLFLPRSWRIGALFVSISAYFLFVGSSPAVTRSWLTASLFLLGEFLNRPTNGLNLLGTSLGIEVIGNPQISEHLGFQLSFLSCAGILLLHPLFDRWMQSFLPKRSSQEINALTLLAKHGHLLSAFFRSSISLTLSVNSVLLPILLYHFHQFPLLGLIYNLFFPFLVGVALSLLLLSLLLSPLAPPLSNLFFFLTDALTAQLLQIVSYPAYAIDYSIQINNISIYAIIIFLLTLFQISIQTKKSD